MTIRLSNYAEESSQSPVTKLFSFGPPRIRQWEPRTASMPYLSNTLPTNWPLMLYGNRNRVVTFLEKPRWPLLRSRFAVAILSGLTIESTYTVKWYTVCPEPLKGLRSGLAMGASSMRERISWPVLYLNLSLVKGWPQFLAIPENIQISSSAFFR